MSIREGIVIKLRKDATSAWPFFKGDSYKIDKILDEKDGQVELLVSYITGSPQWMKELGCIPGASIPFRLILGPHDFTIEIAETMEHIYRRNQDEVC